MQYKPEGTLNIKKQIKKEDLKELINTKEILEGTVEMFKNNKLIVAIDNSNIVGEIDISEFEDTDKKTKTIAMMSMVGKKVQFVITNADNKILSLSRREAQKLCRQYIDESIHKGNIIDAVVLDVTTVEAYLDIGCGCKAIMYREDISINKLADAKAVLYKGQKIKAVVKDKTNKGLIMSQKELLGTFEENVEYYGFQNGDTIIGKIHKISRHGIYVTLGQNLIGLAECSDIEVIEGASVGDSVTVHIKSIIPQKVKVKLRILGKSDTEMKKQEPHYFIRSGSIKVWRYSPENALKTVEIRFE